MFSFLLLFFLSTYLFGQVQKFPQYGFQVQSECKLYDNKDFRSRSQGTVDIIASLVCAANKNIIYNLNVYRDNSGSSEQFNRNYISNLKQNKISYSVSAISGIKSIEYTFYQGDLPTKAIVFFYNGKSYLLQVATRENLSNTFNVFRNSFKFLK